MKNTINITKNTLTILLGVILFLSSCKKDDPQVELTLARTATEVFVGESVTVEISSGNDGYSVTSSADATATATVSGTTVTISGIAKGEATITVEDGSGRTATIAVTVKNAIVDATTQRFKWTNTIELDAANGWATTILTDRIAVTNPADKKQYVLSWTGGYTAGDKTNAKLRSIESGKDVQEVALTNFEIQSVENDLYTVSFGSADQNGELVIRK